MLSGKLVRVRYARHRIIPCSIDPADERWRELAERLLELFRSQVGRTRGELEEEVREVIGDDPGQFVPLGLAKLLGDRCEFEVVSGHPPDKLREEVFRLAAQRRRGALPSSPPALFLPPSPPQSGGRGGESAPQGGSAGGEESPSPAGAIRVEEGPAWDADRLREEVLAEVAGRLGLTPEKVAQGLFADLKSEQRVIRFDDLSTERLLHRYNVALMQAVLLRSTGVEATVRVESPQRLRHLLRVVRFHRLVCEITQPQPGYCRLRLDGPLSLFSATQKYGLQLALFLPALLHCREFELKADLLWGPQRKPKTFQLSNKDGLVTDQPERGTYVPDEVVMFAELFRKRSADWDIAEEAEVFPLGDTFWVPQFRLTHRRSSRRVYLEVFGYWNKGSLEKQVARLRESFPHPFILAVGDQLKVDDADLTSANGEVHRYRQMPLPDEIARIADALAGPPG